MTAKSYLNNSQITQNIFILTMFKDWLLLICIRSKGYRIYLMNQKFQLECNLNSLKIGAKTNHIDVICCCWLNYSRTPVCLQSNFNSNSNYTVSTRTWLFSFISISSASFGSPNSPIDLVIGPTGRSGGSQNCFVMDPNLKIYFVFLN